MDTLEIVKILEKVKVSKDDAINLAEAINGKSGLSTKEDIGLLKEDISEVKNDIAVLKTSNKWVIAVLFLILSLLVKVAFFN